MSEHLETYRGVVYPWHCDHMGHMNVMWYTGKFDEATWNLFATLGITPSYIRERGRGVVAVEQVTSYRRELRAGDVVFIRSFMLEVHDKALKFGHEMIKAETGEVAATTEFTGVHFDTSTRRACSIPAEIAEKARALLRSKPA
jgi:acyl-CoA thioester hydrolase